MTVRLAMVQAAPVPGDVEATLQLMEAYVHQAGKQGAGADLVVFPELFMTGYYPELWACRPGPDDERMWTERLLKLAQREDMGIVYGHPSYRAQTAQPSPEQTPAITAAGIGLPLYNAASLVTPDGLLGTYAKVHLFGREAETFTPGDVFPVWDTPYGRLAIQICYDLEFPEGARIAALAGAELLLYPANNMAPFCTFHAVYAMARAMENGVFVATVNRTGPELDLEFCGGSCAAHPDGRWLVEASPVAGLYVCDVDLTDRQALDPSLHYFAHRRPTLYRSLVE